MYVFSFVSIIVSGYLEMINKQLNRSSFDLLAKKKVLTRRNFKNSLDIFLAFFEFKDVKLVFSNVICNFLYSVMQESLRIFSDWSQNEVWRFFLFQMYVRNNLVWHIVRVKIQLMFSLLVILSLFTHFFKQN